MEALSALGLAANIVQFVDFSARLIGNAQDIVETGTTLEISDIDRAATDLKRLNQSLAASATGVKSASPEDAVRLTIFPSN